MNCYFFGWMGAGVLMRVDGGGETQNKAKLSSISNEMMQISTFSVGVGVGGWGWLGREMTI